jgi:hypothetical protein
LLAQEYNLPACWGTGCFAMASLQAAAPCGSPARKPEALALVDQARGGS